MNIVVIGTGYVGLVSGACFSEFGFSVICVDNDPEKSNLLNKAESLSTSSVLMSWLSVMLRPGGFNSQPN